MCHPLFATLVRCVHIFIDLSPLPSQSSSPPHAGPPGTRRIVLVTADQRENVCKIFLSIMTKCCRYGDSLKNVLVEGDLGYLFLCCTSAPCLPQNLCWRRLSADVLMNLSRNTMCPEFINFVQKRGTLRLCVHNLTNHVKGELISCGKGCGVCAFKTCLFGCVWLPSWGSHLWQLGKLLIISLHNFAN